MWDGITEGGREQDKVTHLNKRSEKKGIPRGSLRSRRTRTEWDARTGGEAVSGDGCRPQKHRTRERTRHLLGPDGRRCHRYREGEAGQRIDLMECCEGA